MCALILLLPLERGNVVLMLKFAIIRVNLYSGAGQTSKATWFICLITNNRSLVHKRSAPF